MLLPQIANSEVIHREKSLYRNILVKELGNRRCLVFAVKRGDKNQTCMDMENPKRLIFPYVQMTLSGLLIQSAPQKILIVGLGGGSIPVALHELYPQAQIDIVEIDEAVVRVAKKFFNFKETEKMKVTVQDARVFIKRAAIRKNRYDYIVLDAFTGEYIPEHLMTVEFLEESKSILTDDGVLIANTFSTSRLYDHESTTYEHVFGDFLNLKAPETGNRIILAKKGNVPSDQALLIKAEQMGPRLKPYMVDINRYARLISRLPDWDNNVRVLTDQYSPANLLRD